jgi:hypothetical protein
MTFQDEKNKEVAKSLGMILPLVNKKSLSDFI